jgi:hypothetical protein
MEGHAAVREPTGADRRASDRLFHRDLPGGGFVAIELTGASMSNRTVRVVVERRTDRTRRAGHRPPIIHEEPWLPERGIGDLYRMACDNVAIARELLHLRRGD